MKSRIPLFLLLLSSILLAHLSSAHAASPTAEDSPEFLSPQAASPLDLSQYQPEDLEPILKGTGVWAYQFELISPTGEKTILDSANTTSLLMPASTFKIFTSWWAFNKKYRTNNYLSKMLHESVNEMANATYKGLGGAPAMKKYYNSIALPISPANFVPTDGAGLSYETRTTADLEIDLLEKILADGQYNVYKELLAQPTEDGTLQDRLQELHGKLFAKTGTLNQAVALSGFLETSQGTLVFAMLSNELKISLDDARAKIDSIIRSYYAGLNQTAPTTQPAARAIPIGF